MPEVFELLKPSEVATELRVTTDTLAHWRMNKVNFHKHIKMGERVMYIAREMDEYLQGLFDSRHPMEGKA